MKRIFAAVLALAGCSPEADPADGATATPPATQGPDSSAPTPSPERITPLATLAGEWRVAGIDGESLDEPYGIALSADEDEIWWEPRCAGLVHAYALEGTALTVRPATRQPDPVAGVPPPPVCTIGLPPRLSHVFRALAAATQVGRTSSNGVLFSGGGHSLTVYSQ